MGNYVEIEIATEKNWWEVGMNPEIHQLLIPTSKINKQPRLDVVGWDSGAILEISLRVGVILLNAPPRHVLLTILSVYTQKESRNFSKEL